MNASLFLLIVVVGLVAASDPVPPTPDPAIPSDPVPPTPDPAIPSDPVPPTPEPAIPGCVFEERGHRGHDMMPGFDSTSDGCLVQCANDLDCQGSTFDAENKCWLHAKVERTRYYDACDTCTLYVKNCRQDGCRYLGRGHVGNDIGTGVSSTADACVQSCRDNDNCVGSTFDEDNNCRQHDAIGYDRFYPACDGCQLFLKECTSAAYGCEYRKRGHSGNNIGSGEPSTAEECATACVYNNACKGSTFDVNNKCWQHHDIESDLFYDACDDCTLFLQQCNNAAKYGSDSDSDRDRDSDSDSPYDESGARFKVQGCIEIETTYT